MQIGETRHMPRLFAVICGNSSKARKGTSLSPVNKLFDRKYCRPSEVASLPLPARESGGPLSTGEGLAFQLKDESEEERQQNRRKNPNEPIRDMYDKRLMIQDEEFASGLACTKREGNTLSMGIRCFWDSGDYAPLTKSSPIRVRNAHICLITHITMQELAVALARTCRRSTVSATVFCGYAPGVPSWCLCRRVCRLRNSRPCKGNFGGWWGLLNNAAK